MTSSARCAETDPPWTVSAYRSWRCGLTKQKKETVVLRTIEWSEPHRESDAAVDVNDGPFNFHRAFSGGHRYVRHFTKSGLRFRLEETTAPTDVGDSADTDPRRAAPGALPRRHPSGIGPALLTHN